MGNTAFNLRKHLAWMSPQQARDLLASLEVERAMVKAKLQAFSQNNQPAYVVSPHDDRELAWHYTTGTCFLRIVEAGYLRPTDAAIPKHEVPALWFSRNQVWEPTSAKGIFDNKGKNWTLSKLETYEFGCGLIRFGYPVTKLISWPELQKKAKILPCRANVLENTGRMLGANPSDWMGSMSRIFICDLVIESLEDNKWVRIASPLKDLHQLHCTQLEREAA